jgi:phenylpropionate dioxygenase-like ring-hydroxylating dioxygenase large terminal subunit
MIAQLAPTRAVAWRVPECASCAACAHARTQEVFMDDPNHVPLVHPVTNGHAYRHSTRIMITPLAPTQTVAWRIPECIGYHPCTHADIFVM